MKEFFENALYPAGAAVIGFFWLLAYKHPKTFKAVGAPFLFLGLVGLLGAIGYGLAWMTISDELASYSSIWDTVPETEGQDALKAVLSKKVDEIGRRCLPVGLASLGVVAFVSFFSWVSELLQKEKESSGSTKSGSPN
jgi:hypothetical protein